jgi:hypothetical protein
VDSQAPKLPEVRHFLDDFRTELGRTGRARGFTSRVNGRTPPKYFARAVDKRSSCVYNLDAAHLYPRKRKENVHFLILLIPIKIILLVLILQYIFGG